MCYYNLYSSSPLFSEICFSKRCKLSIIDRIVYNCVNAKIIHLEFKCFFPLVDFTDINDCERFGLFAVILDISLSSIYHVERAEKRYAICSIFHPTE